MKPETPTKFTEKSLGGNKQRTKGVSRWSLLSKKNPKKRVLCLSYEDSMQEVHGEVQRTPTGMWKEVHEETTTATDDHIHWWWLWCRWKKRREQEGFGIWKEVAETHGNSKKTSSWTQTSKFEKRFQDERWVQIERFHSWGERDLCSLEWKSRIFGVEN